MWTNAFDPSTYAQDSVERVEFENPNCTNTVVQLLLKFCIDIPITCSYSSKLSFQKTKKLCDGKRFFR